MVVRIAAIGGALLLAIISAFIVYSLLQPSANAPSIALPAPIIQAPSLLTTEVLTVTQDYQPGQFILPETLQWQEWPESAANPDNYYLREDNPDALEQFENARARVKIFAGEPVVDGKIVAKGGGFLPSEIPSGKVALSIETIISSRAGGFVLAGDYVNVVATRLLANTNVSSTILNGIKVLAVGQRVSSDGQSSDASPSLTATLELWPWQAERLVLAARDGEISLALRSLADVEAIAAADFDFAVDPSTEGNNIDEYDPETATRAFRTREEEVEEEEETIILPKVYR